MEEDWIIIPDWLPGWTVYQYGLLGPKEYATDRAELIGIGKALTPLNAFPTFDGIREQLTPDQLKIHGDGTSGNIGKRIGEKTFRGLIITNRGADKTALTANDFSFVFPIDWKNKIVHSIGGRIGVPPSTDTPLAEVCLEFSNQDYYIHTHRRIPGCSVLVKLPYPTHDEESFRTLRMTLEKCPMTLNMIGHDPLRSGSDNEIDASIILRSSVKETTEYLSQCWRKAA